jgi:hypothetical protein
MFFILYIGCTTFIVLAVYLIFLSFNSRKIYNEMIRSIPKMPEQQVNGKKFLTSFNVLLARQLGRFSNF